MESTLAASLAFAVASAAAFALVARTVHRRPVSPEARLARDSFVAFWACLALVEAVAALLLVPGLALTVPFLLGATMLLLFVVCAGLAGLQYYLMYLYVGSRRLVLLASGYMLLFLLLVAVIAGTGPFHVEQTGWGPQLKGERSLEGSPLSWMVALLFIGPTLWAAGAYLRLYGKVTEPMQKRRILLVGLSILFWFGTSLVGTAGSVGVSDWWPVASRSIALVAAGTIYYAYAGLKPQAPQPGPDEPTAPNASARDVFDPRRKVAHA